VNKSPAVARTTSLCLAEIGRDRKDEGLLEAKPCPRLTLSELDIFIMLLIELIWEDFQDFMFEVVGPVR